jgi:hypothetical protein
VEQSSNDDAPMYTVHFDVCASTLIPLSGPSQKMQPLLDNASANTYQYIGRSRLKRVRIMLYSN